MSVDITCVVCHEVKYEGKFVVPEPELDLIMLNAFSYMQNLWWMTNHHALANENGLPDEEKSLRYHRKFRLSVMKLKFKCQSYTTQAKRGRPAKNEETTRKFLETFLL